MFYLIVFIQAIGRSGFAWYELQWGFTFDVSHCQGDSLRYTVLIYATIITPLVSVGYLAIFLMIEPHAYNKFKSLFCNCGREARLESAVSVDKSVLINSLVAQDQLDEVNRHWRDNNSQSTATSTSRPLSSIQSSSSHSHKTGSQLEIESQESISASTITSDTAAAKPSASSATATATSASQVQSSLDSSLATGTTKSSFAFAPRETSMSSAHWGGGTSSFWGNDMDDADDREEAELLDSINNGRESDLLFQQRYSANRKSSMRASWNVNINRISLFAGKRNSAGVGGVGAGIETIHEVTTSPMDRDSNL